MRYGTLLPTSLSRSLHDCLAVELASSFHMLTASGRIRIWKLPMAAAPVRLGNKFDLFQITARKQWTILFILAPSPSRTLSLSSCLFCCYSWLHFLVKPPNRILLCGFSLRAIFIIYISKSNSKWNLRAWAGLSECVAGGLEGGGWCSGEGSLWLTLLLCHPARKWNYVECLT